MRILHTSDWHIGHTLYDHDRSIEQISMLNQIKEIVANHKPDLFLISGDLFHVSQPSNTVTRMLNDALLEIRDTHPGMAMVVTAGNHDSASRHETHRSLWHREGIHFVGILDKTSPDDHIIEIEGKGWVVAVPYVYERNIPEEYPQQLLDIVARKNVDGLPVVMTAHTTIGGCDFRGHENANERIVGGIESMDISKFGEGYDYFALGHIHRPQTMRFSGKCVRYSGSPLAVGFDETSSHGVTIVDITHHGDTPAITEIDIENPRPLVTIPNSTAWAPWEEILDMLKEYPADIPAYLRLNVEIDDFIPFGAADEAREILKKKAANFCTINPRRRPKETPSAAPEMTIQEFRTQSPIEIFRLFADHLGITLDEELEDMFREAERLARDSE